VLAVHGPHLAVRADGARVREITVEPRRADERDDPVGRARDLLDRRSRLPDEARPQEQVLGRVAGDGELGEDDEIGARVARRLEVAQDALAVPLEVADDRVELGQCDPQGFRLTVGNIVYGACRPSRSTADTAGR
jgi:hypothetical protein